MELLAGESDIEGRPGPMTSASISGGFWVGRQAGLADWANDSPTGFQGHRLSDLEQWDSVDTVGITNKNAYDEK